MINEAFASQRVVEKLRNELVPNYPSMDMLVQAEITNALLTMITQSKSNQELCELSRKGVLD